MLRPLRYNGLSLRYSLTLGSAHSPTAVIKKLLSVLSLKCTDIFLDLRMNSVEAVYRSLYKLILLQALSASLASLNEFISPAGLVLGSPDGGGLLQYEAVQLLFCLAFEVVFTVHRSLYRSLLPPLHKRTFVLLIFSPFCASGRRLVWNEEETVALWVRET
ncbi:telomerase reverse transcriptase-like, partial [Sinocyclocheilus grahami]|uniref:telomerase reverse transcriptase-like n=1 Tax=Sinocyclocheilus grahami TaxID=75366 RepID=UPI0007AD3E86